VSAHVGAVCFHRLTCLLQLSFTVQSFGQSHAKFCVPKGGSTPADLGSPERWGIGDLIPFTQIVRSFERDVNAAKADVEKLYEQVFEFSGQMTNGAFVFDRPGLEVSNMGMLCSRRQQGAAEALQALAL